VKRWTGRVKYWHKYCHLRMPVFIAKSVIEKLAYSTNLFCAFVLREYTKMNQVRYRTALILFVRIAKYVAFWMFSRNTARTSKDGEGYLPNGRSWTGGGEGVKKLVFARTSLPIIAHNKQCITCQL